MDVLYPFCAFRFNPVNRMDRIPLLELLRVLPFSCEGAEMVAAWLRTYLFVSLFPRS